MAPQNPQIGIKPRHGRSALIVSIAIMIGLVVVKTLSENIGTVRELDEGTYKFILRYGGAFWMGSRPQVQVIDIGEIKPERWERDGRSDIVTPRGPLKELIQTFADRGARSIGIDVDFSPENGQFVHPDDPAFFKWCLDLSDEKKIPIFLGVYRTYDQPHSWLGSDAYQRLAAVIGIRHIIDHDQVPHWIRVTNGNRLRSMSAGLAGVDVNARDIEDSSWSWARQSASFVTLGSNIESKETTIDYKPLPWIQAEVLPVLRSDDFAKLDDKIKDRMVILGDVHPKEGDMFQTIAGWQPGVYIHACAANTIATEPLYRLTHAGRIAIDLGLALAIFLLVKISLLLRALFKRPLTHAENRLNAFFTCLVIVFVILVSVVFVNRTRLLWTDFVLVCLVLIGQLAIDIFRSRLRLSKRAKDAHKTQPKPL